MTSDIQQTIVGLHDRLANALALGAGVVLIFCALFLLGWLATR